MLYEKLTSKIIGCAIEVHKHLGPGLLEPPYKECLYYELINSELCVAKEIPMPVIYKEVKLNHGYRIDLLIENEIVLEVKSIESICDVHIAQTLTYLRLGKYKLGLLINFIVTKVSDGLKRIIL